MPLLTFLDLISDRIYSRVGQQTQHLAYHTKLNKTRLQCEPQSTTHQGKDEYIAPYGIIYGGNQFV